MMLFLNLQQVKGIMIWLDPEVRHAKREIDTVEVCNKNSGTDMLLNNFVSFFQHARMFVD